MNLAGRGCASTVNAGTPDVQCGYCILWECRTPDDEYACLNLYHSEVVDSSGRSGISIAISETVQVALLAGVPISIHLACARLREVTPNISIVAVNAPTLLAEEKAKY